MLQVEIADQLVRRQLADRRARLATALARAPVASDVHQLLVRVDAALERLDQGTFGLCANCHEPIEADRLAADPLLEVCLDHLTDTERRALEADLELAAKLQSGLLPARTLRHCGWTVAFGFQAARVVSGDYCDAIVGHDGRLHVMVGDVSGKGVAAALLMSQMHALFRVLVPHSSSLQQVCAQVNNTLCESSSATHYATLVCMSAAVNGDVTIVQAGHPPALVCRNGRVCGVDSTGLPLGMFAGQLYEGVGLTLASGDVAVFYSDGVTEAEDAAGREFGRQGLEAVIAANPGAAPADLVRHIEEAVRQFADPHRYVDDRTVAVIKRGE